MFLQIIVTLIILGLLMWAVEQIPMDPVIARIIRVVMIVAVVLWLLSYFVNLGPVHPLFQRP